MPHILNSKEKRLFLFLFFIILSTGITVLAHTYLKITKPLPALGKSYTEGMLKEPRTINPILATQDADRDIARLVFSSILTYSGQGSIKHDLAEHYEISEDGKVYTITLKKNVFWHDGEPLTTDDVIFTMQTIQNPQYKSPLRANWQGVSAEKLDSSTIRFTLRTPYSPFVENLTMGIIPKHIWKDVSPEQIFLNELNLKPVGSGPYKFSSFVQAKDGSLISYELERNEKYYREGPYLKKISFLFFKTGEEMLANWHKGKIDGFGPISETQVSGIDIDKTAIIKSNMPRIFGIFFNTRNAAILEEKNIRKAMAHAIDKKAIAQLVTSGGAIPQDLPLPPLTTHSSGETAIYNYDPAEARRILDESGWKDMNGDGIREKKIRETTRTSRGKSVSSQKNKETMATLHFTLTTSDWPDLVRAAGLIKSMLKDVGIDIVIEVKPFVDLESSIIRPRNFQMLLFGQVYGYEPDPFPFWHSSQIKDPGLNISLYSNKKVDQLLEQARRTNSPEERNKKYEEFQTILTKDIPAIFLYSQLYLYLLPGDMKGVEISKISLPADRFNEINMWYIKTKRVLK